MKQNCDMADIEKIEKKSPHQSFTSQATTRAGSHAGRGFRYQDAISAWLAIEIWAGQREPALMIPEGGDDIELRGTTTTFVQVKSRREHLGNYSESEVAKYIADLWQRSYRTTPRPEQLELVLERTVTNNISFTNQKAFRLTDSTLCDKVNKYSGHSDFLQKRQLL